MSEEINDKKILELIAKAANIIGREIPHSGRSNPTEVAIQVAILSKLVDLCGAVEKVQSDVDSVQAAVVKFTGYKPARTRKSTPGR
ncbi:MAG: hypothetical protein NTW14_13405 [bacterium]|nr:hypothetical protein [bacterium]